MGRGVETAKGLKRIDLLLGGTFFSGLVGIANIPPKDHNSHTISDIPAPAEVGLEVLSFSTVGQVGSSRALK